MGSDNLSTHQVVEIITKAQLGVPISDLAQQYGKHRTTIERRIKTHQEEGRVSRKKVTRKSKVTEEQQENIIKEVLTNPFLTRQEIKSKLNLDVHSKTVTRIINQNAGLRSRICPKKFLIDRRNCELRELMARNRSHVTVDGWKKVVFTDESGIDNSGSHRKRAWRPLGKRFDPNYIVPQPNSNIDRLNFFSWVSKFGVGELITYDRMNSIAYCQCISTMIETLREQFQSDDFIIIHDNAKWAKSIYTLNYLKQQKINHLFIPIAAYSPDMNIIENLWAILKGRVKEAIFTSGQPEGETRAERTFNFFELVKREWKAIGQNIIDNLYQPNVSRST